MFVNVFHMVAQSNIVHDFMGIKYIIVDLLLVYSRICMYVNLHLCMTVIIQGNL